MQAILELLFCLWWCDNDMQTKTANAAEKYVLPVLIVVLMGLLGLLLVWMAKPH